MPRRLSQIASIAAASALLWLPASAAAETLSPLPASDYTTTATCRPPSAGHAGCFALRLTPRTAAARSHTHPIGVRHASAHTGAPLAAGGHFGLRPTDLHSAYELPETAKTTQTIALVDAYNDPTAATDLAAYEHEFGLSSCEEEGCFRKVSENGLEGEANMPFPKNLRALEEAAGSSSLSRREEAADAIGWGTEISLDIETARAICENCHILLVEASSTSYANLEAAENTAARLGANEISNSWGGPEQPTTSSFDHPETVITASTGDNGYLGWQGSREEQGYANYPASSPDVIAVGGTRLTLSEGSSWQEETVWNGEGAGGSGCSSYFAAPVWQERVANWSQVGCAKKRAEADISADADPYTGLAITDSDDPGRECEEEFEGHVIQHWCTYGGTSLASPLIAGVFALAGGARSVAYPAETLYEALRHAPGTLHDVKSGSNGECGLGVDEEGESLCEPAEEAHTSCSSHLICLAATGYDGPSGVGTPHGILAFEPGTTEVGAKEPHETPHEEEKAKSKGTLSFPVNIPIATLPGSTTTSTSSSSSHSTTGSGSGTTSGVTLSKLALAHTAVLAMRHAHPQLAKLAYTFQLNVNARVYVTLAHRARVKGRLRWVTVAGGAATISATAGHDSRHLPGRHRLGAGQYRLTLAPVGGWSQSLGFRVA